MNYRHAFHAGNFADVVKHLALVSILLHLRRKDGAFAVIDSHAGRGIYDLRSEAARRTGEAERGIGRVLGLLEDSGALPEALRCYLELVKASGDGFYPGSPLIVARLLRTQDRLIAIEKHVEEHETLKRVLAKSGVGSVRSEFADGYGRLNSLLPPQERRGLVLIDPAFEAPDEFEVLARAFARAFQRFANGIYLIWFPIKSTGEAHAFGGEILAAGANKVLRIDFTIGSADDADAKERLTRAGLIVVNPPFGFVDEMRASLALVAPRISTDAQSDIRWLAGNEG
jgi:23S rRNA (adenine2030-N6)-methyltransferase